MEMNIFKVALVVVGIICVVDICLRIKNVVENLSEIRRINGKRLMDVQKKASLLEEKHKAVKNNIWTVFKCVIGIAIIIWVLQNSKDYSAIDSFLAQMDKTVIAISMDKDIDEIVDPIDYQTDEESDHDYIPSEKVIYEGLYYEECKEVLEKGTALGCIDAYDKLVIGILDDYQLDMSGENNRPDYGDVILDFLGKEQEEIRSLTEISIDIAEYENPEAVPSELYEEETFARKQAYKRNPTRENAYQTARAADDVVAVSIAKGDVYKVLVYASTAIDYYLEMMKYEEPDDVKEELSNNDSCLRISILLEKLTKRSELEKYKPHFRYLMHGFLTQIEGEISEKDVLCKDQFYFYYGICRFNIGWNYGIEDAEYYSETLQYLQKYLGQEKQRDSYTKSCKDSAKKIFKKYPELKTQVWDEINE